MLGLLVGAFTLGLGHTHVAMVGTRASVLNVHFLLALSLP
jgi:hypothetical protein